MKPIYTLSVLLYGWLIRCVSPFNPKARLWLRGRKGWKQKLQAAVTEGEWIWFHCASLGEFEQGRPLIEEIRRTYPQFKIILTFFSPSGYEIRKQYAQADIVCYLPLDTPGNARAFLDILKPRSAWFVKYELWVNFHAALAARKTPVYLVSARMLAKSRFFRSMFRGLYRQVLASMTHIFTQDEETSKLIGDFCGQQHITVAGDTRFDRVAEVAGRFEEVPGIKEFIGNNKVIVCGSTWPRDEKILLSAFEKLKSSQLRWIIAPHEIHAAQIAKVCDENKEWMTVYSRREKQLQPWHRILWIDNIGILSRLYHYADFAYIGGGFDSGIHNILEAVVYGNPVVFGPNYKKFVEAEELLKEGTAFTISDRASFISVLRNLTDESEELPAMRKRNQEWIKARTGASRMILGILKERQLLPAAKP